MVSCYFLQVNVISKRLEISELDLHVTKVEEGLQWMEVILVTIELDEEVPKGEDSNNFVHKNGDELLPR
jgi:hypothetical protein